jgi:hypothetical protein
MLATVGRSRPDPSPFRRVNFPLSPGKAGASRRTPTPARPCTVARAVTNTTKRSVEAFALWRRSARRCRIDGLHSMAEMFQNPLDNGGFLDTGDHPQLPAALAAGFIGHIPVPDRFAATFGRANRQSCRFVDVDGEYPLEALCPAQHPVF